MAAAAGPAPHALAIAPGTTIRERLYEVVEQFGSGAFGLTVRVREARGALEGTEWAVKLVPLQTLAGSLGATSLADARHEVGKVAERMVSLIHDRIVRSFEHWEEVIRAEDGGTLNCVCLKMQLCPGGTLARRIAEMDFDLATGVRWVREVAEALAYVHGKRPKITHGDLKPENVRLDAEGSAVVIDWAGSVAIASRVGARAMAEGGDSVPLMGTPWYMSPERLERRGYFWEDDIWALGLIGLQVVLKREACEILPLSAPPSLCLRNVAAFVEKAKGADAEVGSVLERCLREKAEDRPTAEEVVRLLGTAEDRLRREGRRAAPSVGLEVELREVRGMESAKDFRGLARHLGSDVVEVRVAASKALMDLAGVKKEADLAQRRIKRMNRLPMVRAAGVLSSFVRGFGDASEEVRSHILDAIAFIAREEFLRWRLLHCPRFEPGTIGLLGDSSEGVRVRAVSMVCELAATSSDEVKEALFRCLGLVSGLVGLLGDTSANVREMAAKALGNFAASSTAVLKEVLFRFPGLMSGLVGLLGDSSACVRAAAARTLQSLAFSKSLQMGLFETPGLVSGLVGLLGDSSAGVRVVAAKVLQNLASEGSESLYAGLFGTAGLVSSLVSLLEDASVVVREAAAKALRNLAASESLKVDLFHTAGLVSGMVGLLGNSAVLVRWAAAGMLWNLASSTVVAEKLRSVHMTSKQRSQLETVWSKMELSKPPGWHSDSKCVIS